MSIFMADTVERPSPKAKRMLLAKRFGNRFSTGNALREQHANTLTWIKCEPPDAVVFAASTPEVIEVVKLCAEAARGGDPLRHEHLARRADQCAVRRHPARSLAYEPHPHRASGGPRTAWSSPASRARRSTIICAIGACSSPSTQAPMQAAAWPRPGPPAQTPCATAPCATMC